MCRQTSTSFPAGTETSCCPTPAACCYGVAPSLPCGCSTKGISTLPSPLIDGLPRPPSSLHLACGDNALGSLHRRLHLHKGMSHRHAHAPVEVCTRSASVRGCILGMCGSDVQRREVKSPLSSTFIMRACHDRCCAWCEFLQLYPVHPSLSTPLLHFIV